MEPTRKAIYRNSKSLVWEAVKWCFRSDFYI